MEDIVQACERGELDEQGGDIESLPVPEAFADD